jgi:hypothetical protein
VALVVIAVEVAAAEEVGSVMADVVEEWEEEEPESPEKATGPVMGTYMDK